MQPTALTTELSWLTLTILMTALFWIPYVLNRLAEHGMWSALKNPRPDAPPKAQWADRAMKAHQNAVENLVIFAPLVLTAHLLGVSTSVTVTASAVYFFARLAHFIIYTLGIPVLRTLAFAVGFFAQIAFALSLLGLI